MEAKFVSAIFESGRFRPLAPIDLKEQERVELAVIRTSSTDETQEAEGYLPLIAAEADATVTLEQVQRALSKIPGSLTEDFSAEREERF